MERQALTCPICGAPYRRAVPSGVAQVRCSYCGAAILVPTNAPRCPNHPDLMATAVCNDCGGNFCRNCLTPFEVGEDGERGVLQLCSNCLSERHSKRAEEIVWGGFLLLLFGLFSMLIDPILGILFIALLAAPIIVYGLHSVRSSYAAGAIASGEYEAVRKQKQYRATQEMYQDTLTEFVKSFGVVRGSIMLENRIKAYMQEGLSKEEAIRRLAEDVGY
jgi:hypothetical protein